MNGLEFLTASAFASGWLLYATCTGSHRWTPIRQPDWQWVFAAGLFAVAAGFSINETTQFLTVDENGLVGSVAHDAAYLFGQWTMGAFHTTTSLLSPIAIILKSFGVTETALIPLLKALHWVMCAVFLAAIARICTRYDEHSAPSDEPLLLALLLVLPVDQLAMKVFNYDAIALFGGTLAIMLAARAWRDSNASLARAAIVVATLAASEKLSASPLLLVALVMYAMLAARTPTHRLRDALKALGQGVLISLAISLTLTAIYVACTYHQLPESIWTTAFDPIGSWLILPALFLFRQQSVVHSHLLFGVATLPILAIAVMALVWLENRHWSAVPRHWLSRVNIGSVLAVLLLAGIAGVLAVQPYWAPMAPTAVPQLQHAFALNGIVLHFGADNLPLHYLEYCGYCAAVIICAIPSILWLGLIPCYLQSETAGSTPGLKFLVLLGLLLTLVALINGVPVIQKYLSVAILPIALFLGTNVIRCVTSSVPTITRICFVATLSFGVMLELLPFGPLQATFRPFWASYSDTVPRPGVINPSWIGWGEELMQAGKELDRQCIAAPTKHLAGVACVFLRLHSLYPGVWLHASAIQSDIQSAFPNPAASTSADYYVLNRSAVVQNYTSFPTIAPDFVISARGYPMAWVYRGDRLAQAK